VVGHGEADSRLGIREVVLEKVRLDRAYRIRFKFLACLIALVFAVLVGRLFSVQILQHEKYLNEADIRHKLKIDIVADRGKILDRYGVPLAVSRDRFTMYLDVGSVKDAGETAKSLSTVSNWSTGSLEKTIRSSKGRILINRKISRQKKEEAESLGIDALIFELEKERYYPYNGLAAQVIGYAGMDNKGLEGIEGYYDNILAGVDGSAILYRDGLGGRHINPDLPSVSPRSGQDIKLTIDKKLQEVAENALDRAIERHGARSGSVVVMEPYSGEILALACYPRIDLNSVRRIRDRAEVYAAMRNRVITDAFEPGSTFKIVALTSILEKGLANLDERIFCENGSYKVCKHLFHDIHEYGWLKVREVFELSSNIGIIKLAERLEEQGLYQMARKYGFGSRTGIDFPGESGGILNHLDKWSGLSLASISIGQEVCVTPLQMVMAYSAIANGGRLMKPIFIKEIRDTDDKVVFRSEPEVIREVMTGETCELLQELLVGVVEQGTGVKSRIEGYQMAGKTGTAQKSLPGERGYARGKYITTFGGFYPAQNPRYAVFVMLDEPERDKWGGESAAPLFRELAESTIHGFDEFLVDAAPGYMQENSPGVEERYEVVYVTGEQENREQKDLGRKNDYQVFDLAYSANDPEKNRRQNYPFIASALVRGKMPDLSGLALREAYLLLAGTGLSVKLEGMGRVVKQEPAVGEEYTDDDICLLQGENF
jgi:cell division protein FtsI/penicillin-binding protein 2